MRLSPQIRICQGTDKPYPAADVNVVIDVIRAFTVAHIAFQRGVREIFLVNTVEEAVTLRSQHPHYLLAGEIKGLPIPGFDLDNSPYRVSRSQLDGRTLVQKTTNGVKATLAALSARHVFVTGFSNAAHTASHVRSLVARGECRSINLIASHPQDDDDLACAEFIRGRVLQQDQLDPVTVVSRIRGARSAAKFQATEPNEFEPRDLDFCVQEVASDFVMQVAQDQQVPCIRPCSSERVDLS